ncbi:hypothetical protein KAR91_16915 [Candidatus Pacearchaeota archaeon]|nr:hypothetical protein [Candidatus Pacearchaeota archaeon]
MPRASTLVQENNRLRAATNAYNNTVVPKINAILEGYGLSEPITLEQIQGLTLKQLGAVLRDIAPVLGFMGVEIADRKFEDNLAAVGYSNTTDAIADIPNHLTGDSATYAAITLNHTVSNIGVLEGLDIRKFLDAFEAMMTGIKDKVDALPADDMG